MSLPTGEVTLDRRQIELLRALVEQHLGELGMLQRGAQAVGDHNGMERWQDESTLWDHIWTRLDEARSSIMDQERAQRREGKQ